jgi:hypothetical protein
VPEKARSRGIAPPPMDALDDDPGFQAAFLRMDRSADCDARRSTTDG